MNSDVNNRVAAREDPGVLSDNILTEREREREREISLSSSVARNLSSDPHRAFRARAEYKAGI